MNLSFTFAITGAVVSMVYVTIDFGPNLGSIVMGLEVFFGATLYGCAKMIVKAMEKK
jgi:hypothetical protein